MEMQKAFRRGLRAAIGLAQDVLPAFVGKEWALRESEKLARMERALTYVVQQTPEGFGHAVYQSREFVGYEPFLLPLGDHIYISQNGDRCASQLIHAYNVNDADSMSAVKRTPSAQLDLFGAIRGLPTGHSGLLYAVAAIKEKPDASALGSHRP
jgi:UTP--glucose-1-phosphate uridylyltransferase